MAFALIQLFDSVPLALIVIFLLTFISFGIYFFFNKYIAYSLFALLFIFIFSYLFMSELIIHRLIYNYGQQTIAQFDGCHITQGRHNRESMHYKMFITQANREKVEVRFIKTNFTTYPSSERNDFNVSDDSELTIKYMPQNPDYFVILEGENHLNSSSGYPCQQKLSN